MRAVRSNGWDEPGRRSPAPAFSLVELLVVIAIIGLLLAVAVPSLTKARQVAVKTACAAHLHQVGLAVDAYRFDFGQRFPDARYMPPPMVSLSPSPPLTVALRDYLAGSERVFKCPGDAMVYDLTGSSYNYNAALAGRRLADVTSSRFIEMLGWSPGDIYVAQDHDGDEFVLETGESIYVPWFHIRRNMLFADGHVGEFR